MFFTRDFNLVTLDFILTAFFVNFLLLGLPFLLQLGLLVVELVLKRQEVLVQRDSVSEERFISGSFVFLINLTVLKLLDLQLHRGDLLLQVINILLI